MRNSWWFLDFSDLQLSLKEKLKILGSVFHSALKIWGGWKRAINNLDLKASIKTENKKIWSQLKTQIKHFHSFNIQT